MGAHKQASALTAQRNREAGMELPFAAEEDFTEARRGLIAPFEPATVSGENGRAVWDMESYDFLAGDPPAAPEPLAAEQAERIAGLFEMAPGFYQLRGFDLSNMHVAEGEEGIVVIDPLISAETAAAALALPLRRRQGHRLRGGDRGARHPCPGACWLPKPRDQRERLCTAMGRRAAYMYGARLERGADGQAGAGLGQTTSLGTVTMIPPNLEITETGQEESVELFGERSDLLFAGHTGPAGEKHGSSTT